MIANCSFVPTPSVLETSIGSLKPDCFKSNKPPKPPNSPVVPFIAVAFAIGEISETSSSPKSMFTPASL